MQLHLSQYMQSNECARAAQLVQELFQAHHTLKNFDVLILRVKFAFEEAFIRSESKVMHFNVDISCPDLFDKEGVIQIYGAVVTKNRIGDREVDKVGPHKLIYRAYLPVHQANHAVFSSIGA